MRRITAISIWLAVTIAACAMWTATEASANPPYKMIEICWNGETIVVPLWQFKQGEFPGATEGACVETPPPTEPTPTEPTPAEPPAVKKPPAQPPIVTAPPTSSTPSLPFTGGHWYESRFLWAGLLTLVALSLVWYGLRLRRNS